MLVGMMIPIAYGILTAAKNNSSSFQVLFEGAGSKDGQNIIWTTDANGIRTSHTDWITDAQAILMAMKILLSKTLIMMD